MRNPGRQEAVMRMLLVLIVGGLLGRPAVAQEWKQLLAKELVTIKAGKMVTEEYDLVKINVPGYEAVQLQLKVHAEAPAVGLMSRDNFVAITAQMMVVTFLTVYAEAYQVTASQFLQAGGFHRAGGADRDAGRGAEPVHDE